MVLIFVNNFPGRVDFPPNEILTRNVPDDFFEGKLSTLFV